MNKHTETTSSTTAGRDACGPLTDSPTDKVADLISLNLFAYDVIDTMGEFYGVPDDEVRAGFRLFLKGLQERNLALQSIWNQKLGNSDDGEESSATVLSETNPGCIEEDACHELEARHSKTVSYLAALLESFSILEETDRDRVLATMASHLQVTRSDVDQFINDGSSF